MGGRKKRRRSKNKQIDEAMLSLSSKDSSQVPFSVRAMRSAGVDMREHMINSSHRYKKSCFIPMPGTDVGSNFSQDFHPGY